VFVGFDITALYVAQAGIFYYDYNLVTALLSEDEQNDYLLLDYRPIHGGYVQPPELRALGQGSSRATVRHVHGLRHRKLSRLRAFQRPYLSSVAAWVDGTLLHPWGQAAQSVMDRRLSSVLDGVDIFHSSDVLPWRHPDALNVTTIYDLTPLLLPEYHTQNTRDLHEAKYKFAQEQADVIITISEATKRDIVTNLHIPEKRIHVVYGGVAAEYHVPPDVAAMKALLASHGLAPGGYVLYVGTLEPRKNLVRLIEAYHAVRLATPHAPPLVLIGAAGWEFRAVFARIEELELEEHVRYLGRVDRAHLPLFYAGARFFIFPSLYEGFGLPPLEAMACGTPVIVSDVSSLPEVVDDAGYLVDPKDTQAIAAAMLELLHDETGRCAELAELGRKQASQFSWAHAATRLLSVYEAGYAQFRGERVPSSTQPALRH
jgi:glycosyltransferase involved in cell wall biosynthesis